MRRCVGSFYGEEKWSPSNDWNTVARCWSQKWPHSNNLKVAHHWYVTISNPSSSCLSEPFWLYVGIIKFSVRGCVGCHSCDGHGRLRGWFPSNEHGFPPTRSLSSHRSKGHGSLDQISRFSPHLSCPSPPLSFLLNHHPPWQPCALLVFDWRSFIGWWLWGIHFYWEKKKVQILVCDATAAPVTYN